MSFGNYAPFYRPNYYPAQPMQPMQPMQAQGNFDSSMQYNQPYQQPMQSQMHSPQMHMPMQSQPFDDRIWVQGEAGAKAYLVAPNATVVLWDTERPTLYIKRADATGKPLDMDIIDCTKRNTNAPNPTQEHVCKCGNNFVSKEAFKALEARFNDLTAKFDALSNSDDAKESDVNG